jgi:mersacidin/lichenicidin family type 2 lantibiotic
MDKKLIIRAWKDPTYRTSLTTEQRLALPECPSGTPFTELDETDMLDIIGGRFAETRGETSCAWRCVSGNVCTDGGTSWSLSVVGLGDRPTGL